MLINDLPRRHQLDALLKKKNLPYYCLLQIFSFKNKICSCLSFEQEIPVTYHCK